MSQRAADLIKQGDHLVVDSEHRVVLWTAHDPDTGKLIRLGLSTPSGHHLDYNAIWLDVVDWRISYRRKPMPQPDPATMAAARMFNTTPESVTVAQRQCAKLVAYHALYTPVAPASQGTQSGRFSARKVARNSAVQAATARMAFSEAELRVLASYAKTEEQS